MDVDEQESAFIQPTPEQLAAFAAGDPIAEDEVLRLILPQLVRWAWKHYDNLPPDEVESTIHQVMAETCRPVVRYDPAKSKLTTYLIRLIKLRLNDVYAKRQAIAGHEESVEQVRENLLRAPYNVANNPDASAAELTRERFFAEAALHLNEQEREMLELMRAGIGGVEPYAAVLSKYGPVSDPARDVKNAKVRLQRRLDTLAGRLGYPKEDLLDEYE